MAAKPVPGVPMDGRGHRNVCVKFLGSFTRRRRQHITEVLNVLPVACALEEMLTVHLPVNLEAVGMAAECIPGLCPEGTSAMSRRIFIFYFF